MKKALIILAVILNLTFTIDNCQSQWIFQAIPSNYEVKDIKFFDANTGIITINLPARGMLRTTNGGNNWIIMDTNILIFDIQKIDSNTMYAVGRNRNAIDRIQRTTNKGLSWDSTVFPLDYSLFSLSFVNKDTGWVSGFNGGYLIWLTTNGGVTLVPQTGGIGNGAIFFLKQKVNGEYYGWQKNNDNQLWRTTNSGVNWFQVTAPTAPYLFYIQFVDGNTGWFSAGYNGIYKTTNGGSNWVNQPLAPGIPGLTRSITKFKIIDKDTLYGVNGTKSMPGGREIGIIWKTTNGGLNWGYQGFDTTYMVGYLTSIDFVNPFEGWAYNGNGIHTTNGGGSLILSRIYNNSNEITEYQIYQNYPNPFNPSTTIEFSLPKESYVKLKILDLSGKTVFWVVYDMLLFSGLHKFKIEEFRRLNLSSGVYFYQMEARDINSGKLNFSQSRKMILLK